MYRICIQLCHQTRCSIIGVGKYLCGAARTNPLLTVGRPAWYLFLPSGPWHFCDRSCILLLISLVIEHCDYRHIICISIRITIVILSKIHKNCCHQSCFFARNLHQIVRSKVAYSTPQHLAGTDKRRRENGGKWRGEWERKGNRVNPLKCSGVR